MLWVRPNRVGGTEFYIRNILEGLKQISDKFEAILILSKDNFLTFEKYFTDKRFKKIVCNVKSENVIKRVLWQNLHLNALLRKENIGICFEPIYSKPFFTSKKIKFITTIHDLQALHYPTYQNKYKVVWLRLCWKNSINTSHKIIAISNFVKQDITNNYKVPLDKVLVVYNAINIDLDNVTSFNDISKKYNILQNNFYYTVSSLAPHKNLITIIKVMRDIKYKSIDLPNKLVISGIGGSSKDEIYALIEKYGLEENILLTGFINDADRNALYKTCKAFLFPSVFEGFGMPPIEAMAFKTSVITTKKASLYEVTEGKALYVDNPYDVNEWIKAMIYLKNLPVQKIELSKYDSMCIARKYLNFFSKINYGKL